MPKINTILVFTVAFFAGVVLFPACSVSKAKKTVTQDSTSVSDSDSGRIKKEDSVKRSDSTYTRETFYYGKDTVTNNYYTTPAIIIRETGKQSREEKSANQDSAWERKQDSTAHQQTEVWKTKEEKFLSFWQIAALVAGAIILFKLLPALKISFK